MVAELKKRHITPMITLHHFTNPIWIESQCGWDNPAIVDHFVRYALRVVERLGPEVPLWCTINEPTVEVGLGYMVGTFPPGRQNLGSFLTARRHILEAHRRLYTAIHDLYHDRGWTQPQVSFAHHLSWVEPSRPGHWADRLSTWIYNRINNAYFLAHTADTTDFIGINYYFYRRLRFALGGDLVIAKEVPVPEAPSSDLGWQVVPQGLYRLCMQVARYGKPIYITENGLADASDQLRPWSIATHAQALQHAIEHGADVRGYFHWSLLDTFEWENGYSARYGLVAVDFDTQKRTPRASSRTYAQLAQHNQLPDPMPKKPPEHRP
jgi:beta-glucosidase